MRLCRARLIVEQLDSRTLPSSTLVLPPITSPVPAMASTSHPLQGTGTSNYVGSVITPDTGPSVDLTGTIHLQSLGTFQLSGWLQSVGSVVQGRAYGELVLTNSQGSITLDLHGGVQPAFSPLPRELVYSIAHTTGAYQNLHGYGVVGMVMYPAPTAYGLPPRGIIHLNVY